MEIIKSYKELKFKTITGKTVTKPALIEELCKKYLRKSGDGYVIKSTFAGASGKSTDNCYVNDLLRDWAEQTGANVKHLRVEGFPFNRTDYYLVTDPLMSLLEEAGLK